jgi:capsular polysaccharide transport system permease protein
MSAVPAAERERSAEPAICVPPAAALEPVAPTRPPAVAVRTPGGAVPVRPLPWAAPGLQRVGAPLALVSFLLIVALPTVLATVYYLLIAADQYVAEFRFGLRSVDPPRSDPTSLLSGPTAPPVTVDSYAVVQFIQSRAIIDELGHSLDLNRIFTVPAADFLTRLDAPAPAEDLVSYWRRQVDAFFDAANGTIIVKARAFSPQDSLVLARAVLAAAERLVNELSARARRDALRDSEEEVSRSERRLGDALAALRRYRDANGVIDPRKTAESTAGLATGLRDELVRSEAELTTLREYLQAEAPPLKLLEARIRSLEAQRQALDGEVTEAPGAGNLALSRIMGSFERLEAERGFAETAYRRALEALDQARRSAERQHLYVAAFVPPSLPEKPLYPRRLQSIGIVFVIAFAVWAIGGLTVRSVRDHL